MTMDGILVKPPIPAGLRNASEGNRRLGAYSNDGDSITKVTCGAGRLHRGCLRGC
jgi:hypothetical protein